MLLIGHSHMDAVSEAADAAGVEHIRRSIWTYVLGDGLARLTDEIEALMSGPVVSFIGGSAHAVLGLAAHAKPFDFVIPGEETQPLIEGAQIIPFDLIRRTMLRISPEFVDLLGLISRSKAGPVFHVDSPPAVFAEVVPTNAFWVAVFGPVAALSPPHLRLKCWRAHSMIVQQICAENGVTYLPPPPETIDAQGFLKPEFAGEPAHGNTKYGERVLAQIQECLRASKPRKRMIS